MTPGVYPDLSGAEYFAATDWVSSSKLKHHLPEFFRPFTGVSDAKDLGIALHTTVLGTGEPIWPVAASSWQTNAAKEQRASAYEAGHTPILDKELPRIEGMAEAVLSHPAAKELLGGDGRSEVSVFADVDGVPCKARFDRLVEGVGVDLKTTATRPHPEALARAVLDYGYELQADHYLRVAESAGIVLERFVFVFVGKEPPHHVTVLELDESFYERAAVLRDLALERLQHPEMAEAYPGAQNRLTVELPRWARLSR